MNTFKAVSIAGLLMASLSAQAVELNRATTNMIGFKAAICMMQSNFERAESYSNTKEGRSLYAKEINRCIKQALKGTYFDLTKETLKPLQVATLQHKNRLSDIYIKLAKAAE